MPSGKNWGYFLFINLAFIGSLLYIFYLTSLKDIQDNWAVYRCNPMYMPLSSNIEADFTYCVQNSTKSMMGYLLEPITWFLTNITTLSGSFMESINFVRAMIDKIRSFTTEIFQNIFGVFLNIVIEFQRITIGIKDIIGKLVGTMVALMYIIDGTLKTMGSAWNGPPGQLTRKIGNCFHPDTLIRLKNGNVVKMKLVNLGDVLENGGRVVAKMAINNYPLEPLYKISKGGVNGGNIFVTGTHMVFSTEEGQYIEVKNYKNAKVSYEKHSDWFSCLITHNHQICIGKEIFWDWEDYLLKYDIYSIM
jgi:hypothetical protein